MWRLPEKGGFHAGVFYWDSEPATFMMPLAEWWHW